MHGRVSCLSVVTLFIFVLRSVCHRQCGLFYVCETPQGIGGISLPFSTGSAAVFNLDPSHWDLMAAAILDL